MNKRFRLTSLAALLIAAALPELNASPISLNLSEADNFNLLVWGNATLLNSDTEGRVAVGGNASFNSYSIGTHVPAGNPLGDVFVVGGNLNAGHGQVYNGSIYVGGTYSGPGYSLNSAGGSVTSSGLGSGGLPFDFAAAQDALTAKSQTYGAAAANGTSQLLWSTLTLTGTDTSLNIFNIDAAALNSASTLQLNVAAGSHVLINVSGAAATFSNKGLFGFDRDHTLFNFFEASSLSMSGIGIEGSILAPLADVSFISGQMNGQLIANSFAGAPWGVGEMHDHPFDDQPEPPATVPDTANTGLLLAFGLLAGPLVQHLASLRRA